MACRIENGFEQGAIRVETRGADHTDAPVGRFRTWRWISCPGSATTARSLPVWRPAPWRPWFGERTVWWCSTRENATAARAVSPPAPSRPYGSAPATTGWRSATFVSHRIDQGLEPFCVICCEGQALHFGDLREPDSRVAKIVSTGEVFRLHPEWGTGPGVYYCPPKAKRGLD